MTMTLQFISIYYQFLLSIISIKPCLCLKYRKEIKFISELTRYLNACKCHIYLITQLEILQEYHNKKDTTSKNQKDKDDLLGKIDDTKTINSIFDMLIKDISQKILLENKFLLVLKKKWFNSHEFLTNTQISNIKYRHLGIKYKSSFYSFNNQFDYVLAHYFVELKTTKGNINKFLINLLIASLTKKLFYKNADK